MDKEVKLHTAPYSGSNNRKKTKCRIKDDKRAYQSIPIFSKKNKQLLGYKYITHLA